MQIIELPPHCDRAAAAALYPDLLESTGDTPTAIDASKVERLGLAMVQLLLSAAGTGSGISLTNPSAPALEALQMAGVMEMLVDGDAK